MEYNKQIEEMAKIICLPTANKGNCEKCGFKKHCSKFDDAIDLYNAGYRKASDVAEKILNEVDDILWKYKRSGMSINVSHIHLDIAELKKKYESEGEG